MFANLNYSLPMPPIVPDLDQDHWAFAPFDHSTAPDAVVAISAKGRELTAQEVRQVLVETERQRWQPARSAVTNRALVLKKSG